MTSPACRFSSYSMAECVLVTEAHTIGAIAVIRSLGRAGHCVVAISARPNALGFYSRFASKTLVCPGYDADFPAWLRATIADQSITRIIASESCLHAIRPDFAEFAALLPISQDPAIVYRAFHKCDVHARMLEAGLTDHLPESVVGGDNDAYPIRKPDLCDDRVLAQKWVPGVGCGVGVLAEAGSVRVSFSYRRLHEVPRTGGISSLRRNWQHAGILADAKARITALEWTGLAMLEYRWDAATDDFWFIEINSRVWGSMHLALAAGIDFPALLLADSAAAKSATPACTRLTFPLDLQWLWDSLKQGKFSALAEFAWLFVAPGVRDDLRFPGDSGLYWRATWRCLTGRR
jgi:hypothetical protein